VDCFLPFKEMKQYIAIYESECNGFKGELCINAQNAPEAMDKFWVWLKKQPVWTHLWKIKISLREAQRLEEI
jgi:hypothetical protein